MTNHRVMTVREPHASLLVHGLKKFETARPSTAFRGLVFIHAGLGVTAHLRGVAGQQRRALFMAGVADADPGFETDAWFDDLPRGAIIGAARLTACRQQFDVVQAGDVSPAEEAVGLWGEAYDEKYAYTIEHAVAFKTPVFGWRGNVMLQKLDGATYKKAVDELWDSSTLEQWGRVVGANDRGQVRDRDSVLAGIDFAQCVSE